MERNTGESLFVAVAGTLAVAISAATLSSSLNASAGDGGESAGTGAGATGPGSFLGSTETAPTEVLVQIPLFEEVVTAVLFVTLLLLIGYAIRYWRDTLRFAAALTLVFAVALAMLSLLDASLFAGIGSQPAADPSLPAGSDGGSDGSDATTSVPPVLAVFIVGGVGLVGVTLAASYLRSESTERRDGEPGDEVATDSAAIGEAAGRAADNIEAAESAEAVDNEIYDAWTEMTSLLDVTDPETSTPGEFADAAADAGLRPDDVDELTRLFEDVRYGGRTASSDDERRSVTLLRRIEDDYASAGGPESRGRDGDPR